MGGATHHQRFPGLVLIIIIIIIVGNPKFIVSTIVETRYGLMHCAWDICPCCVGGRVSDLYLRLGFGGQAYLGR